jgi:hypothetical protein
MQTMSQFSIVRGSSNKEQYFDLMNVEMGVLESMIMVYFAYIYVCNYTLG